MSGTNADIFTGFHFFQQSFVSLLYCHDSRVEKNLQLLCAVNTRPQGNVTHAKDEEKEEAFLLFIICGGHTSRRALSLGDSSPLITANNKYGINSLLQGAGNIGFHLGPSRWIYLVFYVPGVYRHGFKRSNWTGASIKSHPTSSYSTDFHRPRCNLKRLGNALVSTCNLL